MGAKKLANVPENWIYESTLDKSATAKMLEAINTDFQMIDESRFIITPRKGLINGTRKLMFNIYFRRVKGEQARELLKKHEAAKQ